jgi:phage-related minor tail protein
MALTVDELQVLITAQTTKFNVELEKVQKQIAGLDTNVKKSSSNITKNFAGMATKFISVGAVITATAKSISAGHELH